MDEETAMNEGFEPTPETPEATARVEESTEVEESIDPEKLRLALERLRGEQSLGGALGAGGIAAMLGAAAWAVTTVLTGYQIGWMAVGVGFLVGFAVRLGGRGIDKVFGFLGAACSLLGCGAGNLLAVCGLVAREHGVSWLEVAAGLDAATAGELMVASFSPMDLLFYGIAVYEGYRLSFRRLTAVDLDPYSGSGPAPPVMP
jgi:hypothetical protein